MRDVVVVAGSIAGFSAAAELRARGFDGELRIIGEEPMRTYERPPLSKSVLAGGDAATTGWSAASVDDLDIEWLLGERAVSLDPGERRVRLATGEVMPYDGLVIATGASPRRLLGQRDLAGLHELRSLDDALGLRADLDADPARVVVVGAVVADLHRARGVDLRLGVGVDAVEGDDRVEQVRLSDGQVLGALGWNWPAKTVRYRMALEHGLAWADALGRT